MDEINFIHKFYIEDNDVHLQGNHLTSIVVQSMLPNMATSQQVTSQAPIIDDSLSLFLVSSK
jgi:hypothetical protein